MSSSSFSGALHRHREELFSVGVRPPPAHGHTIAFDAAVTSCFGSEHGGDVFTSRTDTSA